MHRRFMDFPNSNETYYTIPSPNKIIATQQITFQLLASQPTSSSHEVTALEAYIL
jgi:hypothetical protein